ncbi:MAG: phosphoribosylformylglycinamidine synthase I [Myxococcales bacterium]|nr:phosphoribosylformylglycinamidine synthase I [Myxococcales bacterium]
MSQGTKAPNLGPKVLLLHAMGTNRDRDAARACEMAGGRPHIALVDEVLSGTIQLSDYQMLVLPGGFSYGDDLGAGKLWALRLRSRLGEQLETFVTAGKPVLGICNGFQALVKSGLLPGPLASEASNASKATTSEPESEPSVFGAPIATLTRNASAKFECRWVHLAANPDSPSIFTKHLGTRRIHCPVAHGEGRFVARDADTLAAIEAGGHVALRYVTADGDDPTYPANPNGSAHHIAGICNAAGNVLGLMPHPENHVDPLQRPSTLMTGELGLLLFTAGVEHAAQL